MADIGTWYLRRSNLFGGLAYKDTDVLRIRAMNKY